LAAADREPPGSQAAQPLTRAVDVNAASKRDGAALSGDFGLRVWKLAVQPGAPHWIANAGRAKPIDSNDAPHWWAARLPSPPGSRAMIKVCGLSLYGVAAASTRYRLEQYVAGLREFGVELDIVPLLSNEYIKRTYAGQKYRVLEIARDYAARAAFLLEQKRYDLAIVQAELFPFLPGGFESRLLRIPYVYDFDDAFFLKYRLERFKTVSFFLKNKFDPVVARAAAVFAGNRHLQDYALQRNPRTILLPTVVDTDRYVHAPRKTAGVFTVGWIGSPTTSVYLRELAAPLAQLGAEGPVRFLVVGGKCAPIDNVEVVNLPWEHATEVDEINGFDVGVMPLFDDPWARGKCALKLIQYMACGVPVVASPVGANLDVATQDCGFLAGDPAAWAERLRALRDDAALRSTMGAAALRRVEAQYSLRSALPIMAATLRSAARPRG